MRARGFSLVECTVASVLLAAGLLAVVASQRATQRLELSGRRTAEAAEIAASRIAAVRVTGCAGSSGSVAAAVDETWNVAPGPVARAGITLSFTQDARTRVARYEAGLLCAAAP